MSDGSPAEIVSFERFLERRRRLAPVVPPNDGVVPPASTDPADSAAGERDLRTTRTTAVARPVPQRLTT